MIRKLIALILVASISILLLAGCPFKWHAYTEPIQPDTIIIIIPG